MINESSDVETFNLQTDFESDFLPISIAHSALIKNTDHFFKHFNDDADENDNSDVEIYQQILRYSIATLTFAFKINFIRRNFNKMN